MAARPSRFGDKAFIFHAPLREELAEGLEKFRARADDRSERVLVHLDCEAIFEGNNGGRALFPGENRSLSNAGVGAERRH